MNGGSCNGIAEDDVYEGTGCGGDWVGGDWVGGVTMMPGSMVMRL